MAENVVINFEANTQGLLPAVTILEKLGQIDKATADTFRKQTSEYQQQLSQRAAATTTAFEKLKTAVNSVKVDNGLAKALDQSAPVLKTANSVSSLRQQVREATAEAVLLAQQYGDLDPRAIKAAESAAKLKEELSDVNARINALNPEAKFTAIAKLASGIAGGFAAAQGALALFGAESEDVQKALLKVQGALALSQGINQVLGLKDAFTNLRAVLGLTTAAQVANAAATEASGDAAAGAAVKTQVFNAALKVNPIIIALGAVTALAGAYLLLSDNSDDAARNTKALADANLAAFKSVAQERVEVGLLVKEFANENTSRTRKAEIIDQLQSQYPAYFNTLDKEKASIQDVTEAYGRLTQALIVKAQIDALVQKIADVSVQQFEKQQKGITGQVSSIEKFFLTLLGGAGVQETINIGTDRLKKSQEEAGKQTEFFTKQIEALQKQLNELGGDPTKRVEDQKKALKEQQDATVDYFANAQGLIEQYYAELRLKDGERITDVELFNKVQIERDKEKYRELIAAAIAFGGDYTQFLDKLQEINRNNPITPIVKIDPLQSAGQIGFTDKDIEDAQARVQNYYQSEEQRLRENLDEQNRIDGLKQNAREQIYQNSLNALSAFLDGQFELQAEANQRALEQQQELIQQEEELNKSKYDKGIIGIKEFRDTERKLEEERKKAAEEARKREIELKRKADLAARAQAIFQIGIATALNVNQQPGPFGSLIPFWIALGAAQSAAVLARPLPKYQKGTLSLERGSNPTGTDTVPILANEGEAIIPTDKSRAYRPTLEALYKGLLSPRELNGMVMKRLRDGRSESRTPVVDYDTLARKIGSEMAWVLRGRDGVVIKNVDDFAAALGGGQLINRNA